MGASTLQGPHHVAPKSTRTVWVLFVTSASKLLSLISITLPAMCVSFRPPLYVASGDPSRGGRRRARDRRSDDLGSCRGARARRRRDLHGKGLPGRDAFG